MSRRFVHALLKAARLELGLSQEDLARTLDIDVRTYRRYESGAVNAGKAGFTVRKPARRHLLRRMCDELGIDPDTLVEDQRPDRPEQWPPCQVHSLARARFFAGRERLLEALRSWLASPAPTNRIAAVVALGGAGKTATIEHLLRSFVPPAGLFVWSFYENARVEAFVERAANYFGTQAPAGPGDRLDALQQALASGLGHVIVLDGLEVMQSSGDGARAHGEFEDPTLRRLLTSLAAGCGDTRVIVTSRFELADLADRQNDGLWTIHLEPLSRASAQAVLQGWGVHGGAAPLQQVVDRVGCHALSIAMIGSYAASFLDGDASRLDAVDLNVARRDNVLARRLASVLGAYSAALDAPERDLLGRIAAFPSGVDQPLIERLAAAGGPVAGALAGLNAEALSALVVRLERQGLIFKAETSARLTTHPYIGRFFVDAMGVAPARLHAVERAHLAARLDVQPGPGAMSDAALDAVEALIDHSLRSGHHEEAVGLYMRTLGGFQHLGLEKGQLSRGARITRAFFEPEDPETALTDSTLALVAYDRGLFAGGLGDLDLAARCYRQHERLARSVGNVTATVTSLRTQAYTARLEGRLEPALSLITASIDAAQNAQSGGDLVRSLALRSAIQHDRGQVAEADADLDRVQALGDRPFARRSLWLAERRRAQGRIEEAFAATDANLEICRRLGWGGHVAHCHTLLGLIVAARDVPQARAHLAHAREWTARTGEMEVVLRCYELDATIALAAGHVNDALRVSTVGLASAVSMNFGPFALRLANLRTRAALDCDRPEQTTGSATSLASESLGLHQTRWHGHAWTRAEACFLAAQALSRAGSADASRQHQDEAVALGSRLGHPDTAKWSRAET